MRTSRTSQSPCPRHRRYPREQGRPARAVNSVREEMHTMTSEIVGRDEERASVAAFVGRVPDTPSALVLEGEAGIGKSTLWLEGRRPRPRPWAPGPLVPSGGGRAGPRPRRARRSARRCPRRGVADTWRRRAGARSKSRCSGATPPGPPWIIVPSPSRCAMCSSSSAPQEPVLVAVDDVQWLDASSSAALAFALRRLPASHVLVLLARRLPDATAVLEARGRAPATQVQRVPVGPLSVGALHRLLRDRLGTSFARQTLLRIREQSGGNPFFAMELARVLGTDLSPLDPFPVPKTLEELLGARIAGLPGSALEALAFVAALGTPSESMLQRLGIEGSVHPTRGRGPRDRAGRREDPVHPSASGVGRVPRPRRAAVARSRGDRSSWPRTPWSVPVTLRCRQDPA